MNPPGARRRRRSHATQQRALQRVGQPARRRDRDAGDQLAHPDRGAPDDRRGDRRTRLLDPASRSRSSGRCPSSRRSPSARPTRPTSDAPAMPQLRLAEGASAETIDWPNLGYADAYAKSFEVFDRLQKEGTIPADVRFQLQYPTPLASMAGTFVPEDLPAVAACLRGGAVRRPRHRARAPAARPGRRAVGRRGRVRGCWRARWALDDAAGADRARAGALRRPGARRRPGRAAPLLRRLRPPALQAARVAADAGRPRQRRDLGRRSGRSTGPRSPCPRAATTPPTSRRWAT